MLPGAGRAAFFLPGDGCRFYGSFSGVENFQTRQISGLALLSHDPAEGADGGGVDIADLKELRVELVPRAHGGDEGNGVKMAVLGDGQLGGDGVDGVHHIVYGEKLLRDGGEKIL